METVKASYALTAAEQMSFIGAFLGGISVTLLVTIVVFSSDKKVVNWIVGTSALAACSLLITVIAAMRLIIALHPDLSFVPSPEKMKLLWNGMILAYGVGVLSLIASIGLSGWLRSSRAGIVTCLMASIALLFFFSSSIFLGAV